MTESTWSVPVHWKYGRYPLACAIDLPTACSTTTLLPIVYQPAGQDAVMVICTSSLAVSVALGSTLRLTPLSAIATVADDTARIASVGMIKAARTSLDMGRDSFRLTDWMPPWVAAITLLTTTRESARGIGAVSESIRASAPCRRNQRRRAGK